MIGTQNLGILEYNKDRNIINEAILKQLGTSSQNFYIFVPYFVPYRESARNITFTEASPDTETATEQELKYFSKLISPKEQPDIFINEFKQLFESLSELYKLGSILFRNSEDLTETERKGLKNCYRNKFKKIKIK